jgi:hypothetical protein
MDNKKVPKSSKIFKCTLCDYLTSRESQYLRHISTDKHKNNEMDNKMDNMDNKKVPYENKCECGKEYRYKSGLSKHKKFCKSSKILALEDSNETIDLGDMNLLLHILKQNDEFKELIIEQNKILLEQNSQLIGICKDKNTTNVLTNINSNNKTFNLNVFLNETCKDAMNIMEFVDSIKLQLSDLESVGKLGFVEGISNIIVKNLKEMDVHKRPVHCSDSKREVMYIKDDNKWEKENESKVKLRKMIKHVAHKNTRLIPQYKEKHPDCDTRLSEQYNKLIIEAMGGLGDNTKEKEDKIIHKIAKEVVINKDNF